MFQSSTRLTRFATPKGGLHPANNALAVSILYEADGVCNGYITWADVVKRRVSILYEADGVCNPKDQKGDKDAYHSVSILYEADGVCNQEGRRGVAGLGPVSILYEADGVCNAGGRAG